MRSSLMGYRRPNGSVGVRNHVILLPVDDLSNAATEAVGKAIQGTLAIPHPYGRLQFGEDLDLHFRTLIGTGTNPNVAACIVIGIEPKWTARIVDEIAKTGKPVVGFSIEEHGDINTIQRASYKAKEFVQWASELQKEPISLADLTISIKCGESDTTSGLGSNPATGVTVDWLIEEGATVLFGETSELTGGEHLIAARCVDEETRGKFQKTFDDYMTFIEGTGANLLGSQPTQGNIAGGLSTIEEKAMGNIQKTGTKPVVGVLAPAETPTVKGLNFMDTSSAAAECVTLMAAAGAAVHLFTTGQGNIVGNPIVPVIKITANPHTAQTMHEHIDVDVSGILSLELSLSEAGAAINDMIDRTIMGRTTAAEALGHREFVLTKLHRSA